VSSGDAVSSKLKNVFGDAVVKKDLTLYGHIGRLPRFIAEYLIANVCGDRMTEDCLKKVSEVVERYYREP
jgi:predicted ATP-dependent Lon-type protease